MGYMYDDEESERDRKIRMREKQVFREKGGREGIKEGLRRKEVCSWRKKNSIH